MFRPPPFPPARRAACSSNSSIADLLLAAEWPLPRVAEAGAGYVTAAAAPQGSPGRPAAAAAGPALRLPPLPPGCMLGSEYELVVLVNSAGSSGLGAGQQLGAGLDAGWPWRNAWPDLWPCLCTTPCSCSLHPIPCWLAGARLQEEGAGRTAA